MKQVYFLLLLGIVSLNANAQVINFDNTWGEFLSNNKVSDISKLNKPPITSKDYPKYCLMYATKNFCGSKVSDAEKYLSEIHSFGEDNYKVIPGFRERFQDLDEKVSAYYQAEKLWTKFMRTKDVSLDELERTKAARRVCEKGTLAKYTFMETYAHYCSGNTVRATDIFDNYLLQIVDRTSFKLSDVEGLTDEVRELRQLFTAIKALDPAWNKFLRTGESDGFDLEVPIMDCNSTPAIKSYILIAAADICKQGMPMLEKVEALVDQNEGFINSRLAEKIEWLRETAKSYNGDMVKLNQTWEEFLLNGTVKDRKFEYMLKYCSPEAQVKSYVMKGLLNVCGFGKLMLGKIYALQGEHDMSLDDVVTEKIEELERESSIIRDDFDTLGTIWDNFIINGDTITEEFELQAEYCNIIAQIRSWTIKGNFYYCDQGEHYVNLVTKYERIYELKYDAELKCAIQRLRNKVWQCKNYELMLQASQGGGATKDDERYLSRASKILWGELNGTSQQCATDVDYELVGGGVKYIISASLCQELNLAEMGDPDYYQKINTWLENKILSKYCSGGDCKDRVRIFVEGHIEGKRFNGKTYKPSIRIPNGTPFKHFVDGYSVDKITENTITSTVNDNMELGLARAWTVKDELAFMGIPTTVGVYEHPNNERSSKYRTVKIEITIPNLFQSDYEANLEALRRKAGIGSAPAWCPK